MQKHRFAQSVVALIALFALILCQGTWVLAGTTGSITGTVTDKATNAPLADARVTATSPSQSATTTTDATGHFTFLSLGPVTYTLSMRKRIRPVFRVRHHRSVRPVSAPDLSTIRTLRTIARTTSRSSGSLVKSGVTTTSRRPNRRRPPHSAVGTTSTRLIQRFNRLPAYSCRSATSTTTARRTTTSPSAAARRIQASVATEMPVRPTSTAFRSGQTDMPWSQCARSRCHFERDRANANDARRVART